MASISIGDIVLCSQIACRILTAATTGRKNAPRDLRELDSVLVAWTYSLGHLQHVVEVRSSQNHNPNPNAVQNLGFMVHSCRAVLEDLERTTAKYRDVINDPRATQSLDGSSATRFVKSHWRRFMWDLRGESLTRHRQKLETHTAAINLILNTCIWWAFPG